MSSLTTPRIIDNALRLGLGHTAESVTESAARADSAQMGYLDFVDHLLAEEVAVRDSRRFRNALKLSGLPHHKTLDDFDYTFQPGLEPRRIRDLATLRFTPDGGHRDSGTDGSAGRMSACPANAGRSRPNTRSRPPVG